VSQIGRTLVLVGLGIAVLGLLLTFSDRLPFRLGRLPGDITIRGKNSTFYFPLATCLILSAMLTLIAWLFNRR
jgi:hypothetical protein